mmetsp:Transcript_114940/g.245426  ORF Transcript_114940/g.245426 Transcript_114940/m.245426 type:complete len:367 (-) Transcript_114940:98-1198(-)
MLFLTVAVMFAAKVNALQLDQAQGPGIDYEALEEEKMFHYEHGVLVRAVYSKPVLIPENPLAEEQQKKALFNGLLDNVAVDQHIGVPENNGGAIMAHYHKTGRVFSHDVANVFHDMFKMSKRRYKDKRVVLFQDGGRSWDMFFEQDVEVPSGTFAVITNPSSRLHVPLGVPIIHWYRNPVNLILSGYRYHSNIYSAEAWEQYRTWSPRTDAEAHEAIFSHCGHTCGYYDLLQSASEEQGVVIETLMERQELQHMVGNLLRWVNNPQVLHLSMEHLGTDYDATMKCLLKFLGIPETDELVDNLKQLDAHASDAPDSLHVTSGKYDNSALQTFLEAHDTWGAEFEAAKNLSLLVYNRQNKQFGCPVPM